MTEDSEFLTVIPAQYFVVRQKRHKYTCSVSGYSAALLIFTGIDIGSQRGSGEFLLPQPGGQPVDLEGWMRVDTL